MAHSLMQSSGHKIPTAALGTWTVWKDDPGRVKNAVQAAIDAGYRHIDCAHCYKNEHEVGEGIKAKIEDCTIKREDLFVTTKLWSTQHRFVEAALKQSLTSLDLDYIDLYLVHWPMSYKKSDLLFPRDENDKVMFDNPDLLDTWKAMEGCVEAGLAKSIGISNFNKEQVTRICSNCKIKPTCLQIEINPLMANRAMVEFCQEEGIVVEAYAPLGAPGRTWKQEGEPNVLELPGLKDIADRVKKTVAQVILRYLLQRNLVVIPKSITPSRIKENIEVFDFSLSSEDMATVDGLNANLRVYKESMASEHPEYPFKDEL